MFKTTAKGDGKAVKQIPWVLTLHNAAEMIQKQKAANSKIDSLNQELQAIKTASYALKPRLETYKKLQAAAVKPTTGQQATDKTEDDCKSKEEKDRQNKV
ncbi:Trypanosomal VSG domain containing protein [Trypanosoma brucei equiperdum]|uniref:Trypanosomal VSG domain containing protein n=1 Tax=Trypanosoma brucei equiperdum TaxID=630700 RepID=A0A3L6LB30_9TRYP|nr:Trypanosomal VSG domain containing protein [Trypanosoma brucei equiperdum]